MSDKNKWLCIIPYYKGQVTIDRLLSSIHEGYDILLVVNSDTPCTSFQNRVTSIYTQHGIGYGRAVNVGLRYAQDKKYSHALVINQDAELVTFDSSRVEAILRLNEKSIVSSIDYCFRGTIASHRMRQYGHAFRQDFENSTLRESYIVSQVGMPCLAIKVPLAISLGPFDPIYHMFFEDWDLVKRLKQSLYITPALVIMHEGTGSRNPSYVYEFPYLKSEAIYMLRHMGVRLYCLRFLHKVRTLIGRRKWADAIKLTSTYVRILTNYRSITRVDQIKQVSDLQARKDMELTNDIHYG